MKQLLILCMSLSLFTACKDNKDGNRRDDKNTINRDKDDYRNNDDKNKDDKNTNEDNRNKNDDNRNDDDYTNKDNSNTNNGSWSSQNIRGFVSECVAEAVKAGAQTSIAESYCDCMQVKLEKLYPDYEDVKRLTEADFETPEMISRMTDCRGN